MKRIMHMVWLRFSDGTTPAQLKAWEEATSALGTVDGVSDILIGTDIERRGDHPYTHAVVMTFRDEETRQRFRHTPPHDKLRDDFKTVIADRRVFDMEIP